jgi:RNA polymerase-binding transcription factor DksA
MADPADIADGAIAHNLAMALASRPAANPGQCTLECVSCGDAIPEARRLALLDRGCTRCIECQDLADQRGVRV